MAICVTCGDELHHERAEKYAYCTKPECRERNAKGLRMVAVGVNKAADQYVLLNERTEREMAAGRYKRKPEAGGSNRGRSRVASRARRPQRSESIPASQSSSAAVRLPWSEAQENLTLIYRSMGMRPDQIAEKLGVSRYLVTQILLAAGPRGRRLPRRPKPNR
jgi:hypothetical protein